jgi:streptogrisin C
MKRDLGLSGDALRARLAVEAAAVGQQKKLRAELGPGFGGAWLNRQGTRLVVGVTSASSADAVRAAGAQPQLVEHSLADLDAVKSDLDKHAAAAGSAVRSWYADPATNNVVVEATSQAAGDAFTHASGARGVTVKVIDGSDAARPMSDIRGGDQFQVQASSGAIALCSIGFSVSGGFVTAGHCGVFGEATGQNNYLMGHVMAASYPGHDWA